MRIKYIDALRGFTMFLVVFWHVMSNSFGVSDSNIGLFFRLFRMPMFFFISGYIGYKSISLFEKHTTIKLIKRKAFVQLVPTIIIYSVYQICIDSTPLEFFNRGLYGYWFTLVLFELFLLYYLSNYLFLITNKINYQNILFVLLASTIWCFGVYLNHLQDKAPQIVRILNLGNMFYYMPFFIFGLILRKQQEKGIKAITNQHFFTLCTVLFLLGFLIISKNDIKSYNLLLYYLLRSFVLPFLGVTSVFNIFHHSAAFFNSNQSLSNVMQFVGRRTLDIYLLHYFFLPNLSVYKIFFYQGDKEFYVGELFIFSFITILIISICLTISACLRKSDILAKYLFGILPK